MWGLREMGGGLERCGGCKGDLGGSEGLGGRMWGSLGGRGAAGELGCCVGDKLDLRLLHGGGVGGCTGGVGAGWCRAVGGQCHGVGVLGES